MIQYMNMKYIGMHIEESLKESNAKHCIILDIEGPSPNKALPQGFRASSGPISDGRPKSHPFAGEQVPLWGHSLPVRLKGVGKPERYIKLGAKSNARRPGGQKGEDSEDNKTMKKTKVFQRFFAISLILTIVGSEIYRPYAWLNRLHDFGLADSCTNITAVLTASFLFMAYYHSDNDMKNYQIILGSTMGFAIYELMQKYLPWCKRQ